MKFTGSPVKYQQNQEEASEKYVPRSVHSVLVKLCTKFVTNTLCHGNVTLCNVLNVNFVLPY